MVNPFHLALYLVKAKKLEIKGYLYCKGPSIIAYDTLPQSFK